MSTPTPEDIAAILHEIELAVQKTEGKMEAETDPAKRWDMLQALAGLANELNKINTEIGEDSPIDVPVV